MNKTIDFLSGTIPVTNWCKSAPAMLLIPPYGVVIVDVVVVATDVMPIAIVPVEPKPKEVLFR